VWANLLAGKSGAGPITRFDASNQKCQIACEVKPADHPYGFDASRRVDHKIQRQVDPFIVYGIDAAGQALEDAGLVDMDDDLKLRTGCSIGRASAACRASKAIDRPARKGPGRVSPHFVHGRLINLISGQVSIKYGLMGPNHAVVTACSTGAHSIGDAARMIKDGDADVMLAGGAESTSTRWAWPALPRRALNCSYNDRPEQASRPYDKDRDGFVMGEGAAWSCSKSTSTPRRAAPRSMPKWSAMACRAMPITSPRRIPKARAPNSPCAWRCARRAWSRATSTMSTPMAPRPWPTRSNWRGQARAGR
jgi:3-oxoacyl-[acyl-carrier-protein] synthase II